MLRSLVLFACSAAVATALSPQKLPAQKLTVYVLAGQSNMQGHAKVETFGYMARDPATRPLLEKMVDADGAPRTCDDVWISYLSGGRAGDGVVTGKLTAGFGARRDIARSDGKIGPEFAFGLTVAEAVDGPVLLIKTAWGGKSLHTDFRPPSAGPSELRPEQIERIRARGGDVDAARAEREQATGLYYRKMLEHVKAVLDDPGAVCPAYDPSVGYELAGFVWFQGWNDMVDRGVYPKRDQAGGYDAYTENLAHLIRDVRRDLDAPQMPFVVGVMGVGGPIDGPPKGVRKVHANFRAAMAAPAAMPEFRGNVVAVETAPFWPTELAPIEQKLGEVNGYARRLRNENKKKGDGALSRKEIEAQVGAFKAERVTKEEEALYRSATSNAGYHYLGCGKTMACIGEAFARAALQLTERD